MKVTRKERTWRKPKVNIHGIRIEESGLFSEEWSDDCEVSKKDWDIVQAWREKKWVMFPGETGLEIIILENTPVVVYASLETEEIIKKYKIYS